MVALAGMGYLSHCELACGFQAAGESHAARSLPSRICRTEPVNVTTLRLMMYARCGRPHKTEES